PTSPASIYTLSLHDALPISLSIETREVVEDNLSGSVSHELLGKVFDSVTLGICILDRNGLFAEVNKAFCGMFDGDRERMIGQRLDRKSTRLNSSHVKISYAV